MRGFFFGDNSHVCTIGSLQKVVQNDVVIAAIPACVRYADTKKMFSDWEPFVSSHGAIWTLKNGRRLTDKGYGLHDQIITVALERERQLVRGVDSDDLETFLKVMRIMRRYVDEFLEDRNWSCSKCLPCLFPWRPDFRANLGGAAIGPDAFPLPVALFHVIGQSERAVTNIGD